MNMDLLLTLSLEFSQILREIYKEGQQESMLQIANNQEFLFAVISELFEQFIAYENGPIHKEVLTLLKEVFINNLAAPLK